jgi:hypothetical protein
MNKPGEPVPCRSCGAQIVWARTRTGKNMPMDYLPSSTGSWHMWRHETFIEVSHAAHGGERAQKARERKQPRYHPHWATCPNAAKHRRKK